jgi:hypothetical protein
VKVLAYRVNCIGEIVGIAGLPMRFCSRAALNKRKLLPSGHNKLKCSRGWQRDRSRSPRAGTRAMVRDHSDEIRECYRHADDCRRRADEATDPGTKEHYLAMEQRWLGLARGYDFAEKLSRFTDPFSKRKQRTDRPSPRTSP